MPARAPKPADVRDLAETVAIVIARHTHRTARAFISQANAVALTLDLETAELSMLNALGFRGPMKMGELGERIIVRPSGLSVRAKAMEDRGLVERRRSEHSSREVVIGLTKKGEALFQRCFGALQAEHQGFLDGKLSASEQKQLASLLAKLDRATGHDTDRPSVGESRR